LQKVLVVIPKNFDAVYLCGKIYAEQKDTAASFQYLNKALDIAPTEHKTYNTYLSLLNEFALYGRAENIASKYLNFSEPDAAFSYYLGEILENTGKADSAMVWFEKSYTEQPHWKPGLKLARHRMKQGDYREASRLYENVLEQNPAVENGYYELGYLNEYYLGSLENAVDAYQKGSESDTLNNRYQYYINRVKRKIEFQNL
jgi:tetratricopeptide (TPR) repeat protein